MEESQAHGCCGCGSGGETSGCHGDGCGACCGNGELTLSQEELLILRELGKFAFLPVLWQSQNGEPEFFPTPEDQPHLPENFSQLILSLERKRLITIDPDIPLSNVSYGVAAASPAVRCGSLALTLQGQEALDWI